MASRRREIPDAVVRIRCGRCPSAPILALAKPTEAGWRLGRFTRWGQARIAHLPDPRSRAQVAPYTGTMECRVCHLRVAVPASRLCEEVTRRPGCTVLYAYPGGVVRGALDRARARVRPVG